MTVFRRSAFVISFILAAIATALPAYAAGFYIQEQSVSGLGRAFAGSAAHPVDSSTIYTNPAGMTFLQDPQGQIGVHILHPRSSFTDDGTSGATTATGGAAVAPGNNGDGGNPYAPVNPVPNLFISQPVNDSELWMGLGLTAPFGLTNKYDDGWFGRYDSTESDLKVIDFAPSIAYRVNNTLSLGGGVDVQYVDGDLRRAIPDPLAGGGPNPASDGELILTGDSVAVGINAGLLWQPRPDTRIGLHYRSEVNHELEGKLKGTTPAGLGSLAFSADARAAVDLPQMATIAAAHDVNDRLTLLTHAIWFGWDSFQSIFVKLNSGAALNDPQDYEDSFALALGAEYLLSETWTVRGGIQWDETPTTGKNRTTRTPDGNRTWLSGGATYQMNDRMSLDMAATYIFIEDGHINRTTRFDDLYNLFVPGGGLAASVTTRGTAESDVGIIGVALNYKF